MVGPTVSGEVAQSVSATVRQDRWLSKTEPGLQTRLHVKTQNAQCRMQNVITTLILHLAFCILHSAGAYTVRVMLFANKDYTGLSALIGLLLGIRPLGRCAAFFAGSSPA